MIKAETLFHPPQDFSDYVYEYFAPSGYLIYVGMTSNAVKRAKDHHRGSDWWSLVTRVTYHLCLNRNEAYKLESKIRREKMPLCDWIDGNDKVIRAFELIYGNPARKISPIPSDAWRVRDIKIACSRQLCEQQLAGYITCEDEDKARERLREIFRDYLIELGYNAEKFDGTLESLRVACSDKDDEPPVRSYIDVRPYIDQVRLLARPGRVRALPPVQLCGYPAGRGDPGR